MPERFGLETAYPNPFNPVAVVPFALPEAAQVRISVYDVRGRRVAVLASGVYAAGRHRVLFDGSGWSSGVYLVRSEMVTNGGEVHQFTQLLTLVK